MSFDFERSDVQGASIDSSPVTAYPFTMSAWVKLETAAASQGVVWVGDKDNTALYAVMQITSGGNASAFNRSGASTTATASHGTVLSTGTWYNIIAVFNNAADRTVYLNADAGVQNTVSITDSTSTYDRIGLGRFLDSSPSDSFDGLIAHAAVWSRVLDSTERTTLQTQAPSAISSGLVAYWPMNVDENPLSDGSAGGTFDLTLQGTPGNPVFSTDNPSLGGAAGQPTIARFGAVPGMRLGGQTFGRGW
jgi:hypothetical protein